jgi:hypothetical protein
MGKQWPQADLTITANPIALDDETILERVLLIGTRLPLPVHHVVPGHGRGQERGARSRSRQRNEPCEPAIRSVRTSRRPSPARSQHRFRYPGDGITNSMALWPSLAPPEDLSRGDAAVARQTLYSRADRDRWPYDLRFSDTSHQDAIGSLRLRSSADDSPNAVWSRKRPYFLARRENLRPL